MAVRPASAGTRSRATSKKTTQNIMQDMIRRVKKSREFNRVVDRTKQEVRNKFLKELAERRKD
jgi:hypothetical protein